MKKYSKKWRIAAWILLSLFLITLASFIFSGCRPGNVKEDSEVWAMIKLPDGNRVHTRIVDYQATSSGNIYIYTEDRVYYTSMVNVIIMKDLG